MKTALLLFLTLVAAIAQQAPVCTPPPSGLVAWWPADGNTNDIVGGNNGIPMGNLSYAPGMVGQAFQLDGSTAYVSVPHNPSLAPTDAITIDAWIKPSSGIATFAPVVKKPGFDDKSGYSLEFHAPPRFSLFAYLLEIGWTNSYIALVPSDQWSHVAGVVANGCTTMYLNGAPVDFGTYCTGGTTMVPGIGELNIGHDPAHRERYFTGLIDEVEIFNRALGPAEIQAIYLAGPAGKCRCQPPSITGLTATPNTLWPPNHKMVPVTLNATTTGGCGAVSCVIDSVTSNEPPDPDGDWVYSGLTLNLRAERNGLGTGRVYTIAVKCTDSMNTATKTVTVTVPHDQRK